MGLDSYSFHNGDTRDQPAPRRRKGYRTRSRVWHRKRVRLVLVQVLRLSCWVGNSERAEREGLLLLVVLILVQVQVQVQVQEVAHRQR